MLSKEKIFLYLDRAITICLCLLIFCLPFTKAGAETFTLFAFVLWIFKRGLGYRAEVLWGMFPKTVLNRALAIYLLANAVSVIFSVRWDLFLRGFFGKELKFMLIYFMLVEAVSNKKRLFYVLITLIVSALLIMADAGVQYYTQTDFLRKYAIDSHSFSASFGTSGGFAAWLIVIIPIFLGIIALNLFPSRKIKAQGSLGAECPSSHNHPRPEGRGFRLRGIKILLWLSVIIQFMYLLKTYSRGAWIGFLIAILFTVFYFIKNYTFKIKILCLTTGVCSLLVVLLVPYFLSPQLKYEILTKSKFGQGINSRIKSIPQMSRGSNLERIRLWKEALKIIRDYPATGCGLNNYSIVARNYKSFEGGGVYPHNSFLQKAAETGIFGLSAFLFVLFSFFKSGIQHLNRKRDYLVLGLLAGITAFLTQSFFDTNLYALQQVVLFWYMLGLTVAVIKIE